MKLSIWFLTLIASLNLKAQVPAGVFTELAKFTTNQGSVLPESYRLALPDLIQNLTSDSEKKLLSQKNCTSETEVSFIDKLTNSSDEVVKQFEAGFVKIDSTFCFPQIDADLILRKSNEPAFRRKAFSTIIRVFSKDGLSCEHTEAPTIGSSNYCYLIDTHYGSAYSSVQSYNVWNDSFEKFGSQVFFRSIFESTRQVDQKTQYHVITYLRADKLNAVQRFFAKSFIANTQSQVMQKIKEELFSSSN